VARVYDIVDRITNGNKKPTIKIDADHEFKINVSKNAAVAIKAYSDDKQLEDFDRLDKIILTALGREAFDYIESLELSMDQYVIIMNVIMAAISDMSLEEMENFSAEKIPSGKRK
jgi:predicted house-cleaning noncanonical NTP pyrophosphatase (MazG superfamily)